MVTGEKLLAKVVMLSSMADESDYTANYSENNDNDTDNEANRYDRLNSKLVSGRGGVIWQHDENKACGSYGDCQRFSARPGVRFVVGRYIGTSGSIKDRIFVGAIDRNSNVLDVFVRHCYHTVDLYY